MRKSKGTGRTHSSFSACYLRVIHHVLRRLEARAGSKCHVGSMEAQFLPGYSGYSIVFRVPSGNSASTCRSKTLGFWNGEILWRPSHGGKNLVRNLIRKEKPCKNPMPFLKRCDKNVSGQLMFYCSETSTGRQGLQSRLSAH